MSESEKNDGENKDKGEAKLLTLEDVKRIYGEAATIDLRTGAIRLPDGIPQGGGKGFRSSYDGGAISSKPKKTWISTQTTQETPNASDKQDDS